MWVLLRVYKLTNRLHSKAAEPALLAEITALQLHNGKVEAKELKKPSLFNG